MGQSIDQNVWVGLLASLSNLLLIFLTMIGSERVLFVRDGQGEETSGRRQEGGDEVQWREMVWMVDWMTVWEG